jgi:hypothetical protein
VVPVSATNWMGSKLTTQGYCLSEREQRRLRLGLRFPTGACLALVITGLALESAPMLFVLVGIGAVGGFSSRHPFDYVWNHGVRHLFRAPALPPNPPRRRHAFKIATVWLAVVAVLFAVGLTVPALVLGVLMVGACTAVTVANLCIPSEMFAWWDRRRERRDRPAVTA